MGRAGWWVGACAVVVCVALAGSASAENQDPFFLSNEAALTGGAVTAIQGDTGAAWYNPAGIVTIARNSLNISTSAFVLRARDMPEILRLELPGGVKTADLDSFEVLSVPSSIVVTRRFGPDFKLALAAFVPFQDAYTVNADLDNTFEDDEEGVPAGTYRQRLKLTEAFIRYQAGPAFGWRVVEGLRVGGALFAVYEEETVEEEFTMGLGLSAENKGFAFNRKQRELSALGAQAVLGLQWDMSEALTLGLTARSPVAIFKSFGEGERFSTRARLGAGEADELEIKFEEGDFDDGSLQIIAPPRLHLGAAYHLDVRSWISVEVDFTPAFENIDRDIDSGAIINGRLGGMFGVNETLIIGFGLFSDRGGEGTPDELWEVSVDYYGITGGVELRSPHLLADNPDSEDLIFSTTLALRYAIGLGEAGGHSFDPTEGLKDGFSPRVVDVTFHEVGIHLGSALFF